MTTIQQRNRGKDVYLTQDVDIPNSTDEALGGSGSFTGEGVDVHDYQSVVIYCFTDQSGTLFAEFSSDNVNWDSSDSNSVSASTFFSQSYPIKGQYFRIRYVNGATPQTELRIQTLLGNYPTATGSSGGGGGGDVNLIEVGGSAIDLGQELMANSIPTVIASDQSAIPITDNGGSVTIDGNVGVTGDVEVVQATHDDLNANANIQINDVDVGAANPVPVSDNGTTLSVDDGGGSLSIDDGGGSVTIDAASLPLPTGAATAANQLPDGHNVTVDNGAGASAVNIQDGGNSITIDASSLPLPTGAATAANQLPDGHNVTVSGTVGVSGDVEVVQPTHDDLNANANLQINNLDVNNGNPVPISDGANSLTIDTDNGEIGVNLNISGTKVETNSGTATNETLRVTQATDVPINIQQSTASNLQGQVEGTTAAGAAVPNPIHIGGRDILGNLQDLTAFQAGTLFTIVNIPVDTFPNVKDFSPAGEDYALVASTDGTKANATYTRVDSSDRNLVVGPVAHDAAYDGNPPNPLYAQDGLVDPTEPTAVADADAVRPWGDVNGRQHVANWAVRKSVDLNTIETTFNDVTTGVNGADIDITGFRTATASWTITSSGTPTRVRFFLEAKDAAGNYNRIESGYWGRLAWEDTATSGGYSTAITFPLPCHDTIRIRIAATGTTASNTFVVSDAQMWLMT